MKNQLIIALLGLFLSFANFSFAQTSAKGDRDCCVKKEACCAKKMACCKTASVDKAHCCSKAGCTEDSCKNNPECKGDACCGEKKDEAKQCHMSQNSNKAHSCCK